MSVDGPYRRRSARVVLLDAADRVLLLRLRRASTQDGAEDTYYWLTPGGGVEKDESLAEAAARELHEEIGLRVAPGELGRPIALSSGYADIGWASGLFRDDYFVHRVVAHEVDTSGFDAFERRYDAGHRWWPVDELASTSEIIYPLDLVPLLAELLAGRIPAEPVQLPWQH